MRKYIITFIALIGTCLIFAQTPLTWTTLTNVEYRFRYIIELEGYYEKPIFSSEVRSYESREVSIQGFVIPYAMGAGKYFLSKFPNSSCYFCSQAGKASVVKLDLKDPTQTFDIDDVVKFKGILRINESPTELHYILENAVVIERID